MGFLEKKRKALAERKLPELPSKAEVIQEQLEKLAYEFFYSLVSDLRDQTEYLSVHQDTYCAIQDTLRISRHTPIILEDTRLQKIWLTVEDHIEPWTLYALKNDGKTVNAQQKFGARLRGLLGGEAPTPGIIVTEETTPMVALTRIAVEPLPPKTDEGIVRADYIRAELKRRSNPLTLFFGHEGE